MRKGEDINRRLGHCVLDRGDSRFARDVPAMDKEAGLRNRTVREARAQPE